MSTEPAAWVYDLVIELLDQQDEHPTLYHTSGAFEGYAQYAWCPCIALKHVPPEIVAKAAAIRSYKRSQEAS